MYLLVYFQVAKGPSLQRNAHSIIANDAEMVFVPPIADGLYTISEPFCTLLGANSHTFDSDIKL